jgi:small multidrug resistance family-3 protein
MVKSLFYFFVAGLCEIGGGYLVWMWLRERKPVWFTVLGGVILILYGVIPSVVSQKFLYND